MNKKEVKCADLRSNYGKIFSTLTLNRNYVVEDDITNEYQIRNDRGDLYWYPARCFTEVTSDIESLQAEFDLVKKNLKDLEAKLKKAKEKPKSKNIIELAILKDRYAESYIDDVCSNLCMILGQSDIDLYVTDDESFFSLKSLFLDDRYKWTIIDNTYLVIEKK